MSLSGVPQVEPSPRRTVPLTLLVVAVLVAIGVAVAGTAAVLELRPASSATGAGTVTVTDDLGRAVTAPADPSRVVVLGPNVMDTVYRLGLRSHVVGIDCSNASLGGVLGDYTPNQTAQWNLTGSLCIVAYPQLSVEELLSRSPQVVLAATVISLGVLEGLTSTYGIPVIVLSPSTLGGVVYDVQLLAKVFGIGTPADRLVTLLQQALAGAQQFLTNLTNNGSSLRTVMMTYYVIPAGSPSAGYFTFGSGSFGESLIELSGGVNIAANSTQPAPELSGSQVFAANPGVVVYGTGFGVDLPQYEQAPDWSSIPAVQHGNMTGVDVTIMTEVDPTMVLSLHLFRHIFYPALVGL